MNGRKETISDREARLRRGGKQTARRSQKKNVGGERGDNSRTADGILSKGPIDAGKGTLLPAPNTSSTGRNWEVTYKQVEFFERTAVEVARGVETSNLEQRQGHGGPDGARRPSQRSRRLSRNEKA